LIPLARHAAEMMPNGGSIMALTYYAAEKVMPRYNVMAIAKAALENTVRYLAADLGPEGVRVNALSPGPIKTLAAAGVPGFRMMLNYAEKIAPLRQPITQEDVGNVAAFLASDSGKMITGETIYIDGGYHILGLTLSEEDLE
jgi:enoyl-[acyl-carrier protein] reductase I